MVHQKLFLDISTNGITYSAEAPPIENLVLKGGGQKGLVYPGALPLLIDHLSLKRVAGSSVGALTAIILAFGGDANDCHNAAQSLPEGLSTDQADGNLVFEKIQKMIARATDNLLNQVATTAAAEGITNLTTLTFAEHHALLEKYPNFGFKDLFITGTNITHGCTDIFSYQTTPDMPIALAGRISMSIPLVFEAVYYNGNKYVDGGCLDNFPMEIFDAHEFLLDEEDYPYRQHLETKGNLCTLGLFIASQNQLDFIAKQEKETISRRIARKTLDVIEKIDEGFFSRTKNKALDATRDFIVKGYQNSQTDMMNSIVHHHPERTLPIFDENISATDFGATEEAVERLIHSGKRAAQLWLNTRNDTRIEIEKSADFITLIQKLSIRNLNILKSHLEQNTLNIINHTNNQENLASRYLTEVTDELNYKIHFEKYNCPDSTL